MYTRQANPRIRHEGVLMTMYDGRTNLSRQVIDQVEQHLPQICLLYTS